MHGLDEAHDLACRDARSRAHLIDGLRGKVLCNRKGELGLRHLRAHETARDDFYQLVMIPYASHDGYAYQLVMSPYASHDECI